MVETSCFVPVPMFGKQDRTADQVSHQCQKSAANKSLADNWVPCQIDVGKAV